ncbi:MAG: molybdopterin-dependent oxidoreductase [bacterium]|nr:molybdopterin-dependent oxidoreductase [bacterium]
MGMVKLTIDGQAIECRERIPVLQAALEAGWDVPHYCYHPGLTVVASCRLCLMEMQMPHPKTGEMGWAPKMFPACQTPVRDGMVVRFASEALDTARSHCMEYFLLNHPLDCPVCDQAGECYLQDYSYKFGQATARMADQKQVNPKKDIGPKTLLYADRCVMCTRCVRFAQEISGTGELCVTSRGSRSEIDVFPGLPLDNPLPGNVVDICPVGALLDKDFLFKQRVWFLESADSICPGCNTGCAVRVDTHDNIVQRLKPRYNPGVNDWWMCDEGRFGWKYVHDPARLTSLQVRRGAHNEAVPWEDLTDVLTVRFTEHVARHGSAGVAAVLSPMMSCEEAWLLAQFLQRVAPEVLLVLGPVPGEGEDQVFPVGATGKDVKFTIRSEKCPNRRGAEAVIAGSGCPTLTLDDFVARAGKGEITAAWIVGGYPDKQWVPKALASAVGKIELVVAQDLWPTKLTDAAAVTLPACTFAERSGSFMNAQGRVQPFKAAIRPPDGCRRDGQYLYELAGHTGVYNAARVRELMAATLTEFAEVAEAPAIPVHQH